jgi:hypothetical protein
MGAQKQKRTKVDAGVVKVRDESEGEGQVLNSKVVDEKSKANEKEKLSVGTCSESCFLFETVHLHRQRG